MRVLLHDSHSGGGGAPGERDWVADLNGRIVTACRLLGIGATRVPGDLGDHPEFHQDYDAFAAPHYDADIYGEGGAFWDRAAASATAADDDLLGAFVWGRLGAIPGFPPDHFERRNANTFDYYGFRLTTARTPGILVEHGVGAPGAPDHDWLRANIQDVADAWALALAEFGAEGDVVTPEQEAKLDRVLALMEAREDLVWTARAQRSLDVETGAPFDGAVPPIDPRIRV